MYLQYQGIDGKKVRMDKMVFDVGSGEWEYVADTPSAVSLDFLRFVKNGNLKPLTEKEKNEAQTQAINKKKIAMFEADLEEGVVYQHEHRGKATQFLEYRSPSQRFPGSVVFKRMKLIDGNWVIDQEIDDGKPQIPFRLRSFDDNNCLIPGWTKLYPLRYWEENITPKLSVCIKCTMSS